MGSPYRRPSWFARQRRNHPALLAVAFVCAAAVVVEIAAVTNVFGLLGHGTKSTGPTGPNLNPYHEEFLSVTGEIQYKGTGTGYFAQLEGQSVCPKVCPAFPKLFNNTGTPAYGIFFFFNVTNTASQTRNISEPVLGLVGKNTAGFVLVTYCCYSTTNTQYSEPLVTGLQVQGAGSPGATVGLRGFIYTETTIPEIAGGGYAFFLNVTST